MSEIPQGEERCRMFIEMREKHDALKWTPEERDPELTLALLVIDDIAMCMRMSLRHLPAKKQETYADLLVRYGLQGSILR